MDALIHTTAGPEVGYGHVVRCAHLANELSRRGVRVYAWPYRPTAAAGYLRSRAGALIMGPECAEIGVLDTMTYDARIVEELRASVDKLVVIVGAGYRLTPELLRAADLLVFQTGWVVGQHGWTSGGGDPVFNDEVTFKPPQISGPDFIILGPEYARPLNVMRQREALVVFGSGIPWDYTVETTQALSDRGVRGTLVVPPHYAGEYEYTLSPHGFTMLNSPLTLRGLQAMHTVQVGSLGMSTYEALAAGCWPVTVGKTADHVETADILMTMGMGWGMGNWEQAGPVDIASTAATYLATVIEFPRVIDGYGVGRVVERILEGLA